MAERLPDVPPRGSERVVEISRAELMAVFISRQLRAGQYVALAANAPVSTAGVLLASFTHAPGLKVLALTYMLAMGEGTGSWNLGQVAGSGIEKAAQATFGLDVAMDQVPRMDWCFAGALQVDGFGNTNLIGVGPDPANLRFRGPGCVGSTTVSALAGKMMIQVNNHDRRVFVESCDFVSSVGWAQGGAKARERLGLIGGGPEFVVTPLAIMDFEPTSKRMRVKYLLADSTMEEVQDETAFGLLPPEDDPRMPEPTPAELEMLRIRVDKTGVLRK